MTKIVIFGSMLLEVEDVYGFGGCVLVFMAFFRLLGLEKILRSWRREYEGRFRTILYDSHCNFRTNLFSCGSGHFHCGQEKRFVRGGSYPPSFNTRKSLGSARE